MIGLYLWDKYYRTNSPNNLSQKSIIENFIKKYKKCGHKAKSLRHYQRVLHTTVESIEQGLYLPFSEAASHS